MPRELVEVIIVAAVVILSGVSILGAFRNSSWALFLGGVVFWLSFLRLIEQGKIILFRFQYFISSGVVFNSALIFFHVSAIAIVVGIFILMIKCPPHSCGEGKQRDTNSEREYEETQDV